MSREQTALPNDWHTYLTVKKVEVTPSHHRSVWLISAADRVEAWSMEHDGSRVAADLSHEGRPLIRVYGEPERQESTGKAGIYRQLADAHSRWLQEAARNTALG